MSIRPGRVSYSIVEATDWRGRVTFYRKVGPGSPAERLEFDPHGNPAWVEDAQADCSLLGANGSAPGPVKASDGIGPRESESFDIQSAWMRAMGLDAKADTHPATSAPAQPAAPFIPEPGPAQPAGGGTIPRATEGAAWDRAMNRGREA